ncbi:MAG: hypothetical protein ACI8RD_010023, partial [Bacillariaceae sp.]
TNEQTNERTNKQRTHTHTHTHQLSFRNSNSDGIEIIFVELKDPYATLR